MKNGSNNSYRKGKSVGSRKGYAAAKKKFQPQRGKSHAGKIIGAVLGTGGGPLGMVLGGAIGSLFD